MVRILQYPDPRLKTKAEWVDEVNDEIRQIVDDMFETHYNTPHCAALAATQLDFKHPKHITVIDFSEKKDQPLCLINGEILETRGEVYELEGCMSVYPDHVHEKVKRPAWLRVRGLDRDGNPIEFEAEGFMAKCIQHELDHLNGSLYLDRLSSLKRQRLDKKIQKFRRLLHQEKEE